MARSRSRSPDRGYGRGGGRHDSRHRAGSYDRDSHRPSDRERDRYRDRREPGPRARYESRTYDRDYDRKHDVAESRYAREDRRSPPRATYRPVREREDRQPHTRDARGGSTRDRERSTDVHDREHGDRAAANKVDAKTATETEGPADDDAEAQMAAMMGFGGFGSTKGESVRGNGAAGGISRPPKVTKYRQFMNRPGGFNKSLSPER